MPAHPLGRRKPTDWKHVERFPLSALEEPPTNVPVALGINWYSNFDDPEKVGNIWVIGRGSLGRVRGGHCICAKPPAVIDQMNWYSYYDQGVEGSCVGFGCSRVMTLLNRKLYNARWLYEQAQLVDEWPSTPPEEGSSVRAGLNVLQHKGGITVRRTGEYGPYLREGIAAYRWATSWDEVRSVLGVPDKSNSIPLLNSWGTSYPHIVHLLDEAGERLLNEEGEIGIVTDR